MAQQEYPSLNGVCPSWSDIRVSAQALDGGTVTFGGIKDVSWSETVEVGEQMGASGGRVMKRTTGSVKQEAKLTLYLDGYKALEDALAGIAPSRAGQKQIGLAVFDLNVQWTPAGDDTIHERRIKGCRMLGRSESPAEGNDPATVECTLSVMQIASVVDGEERVLL